MLDFLAPFAASIGANALKIGLALLTAAALFGGGFVLGDEHASGVALKASAGAAQDQIAALSNGYQAEIDSYADQLKAQRARADQIAVQLAQSETARAAAVLASQQKVSHVVPSNSACDLSADALDLLRTQPARN